MASHLMKTRAQRPSYNVAIDASVVALFAVALFAAVVFPKASADTQPAESVREVAAQGQLYTYEFRHIFYFADGTQHEESFTTIARNDDEAYAYSSNKQLVRNQQFAAAGRPVSRSSGIMVAKEPIRQPGSPRQEAATSIVTWDATGADGVEPQHFATPATKDAATFFPVKVCFYERDLQYAGSSLYYDAESMKHAIENWTMKGGSVRVVGKDDDCPRLK